MTHRPTFALLLFIMIAFSPRATCEEPSLVFFGWSDQHVQTDGSATHVEAYIDAMNEMPGTPYPPSIGGQVERPAFVFGCGDITEWPTRAARDTYNRLLTRLEFPAYDILGNHDDGGLTPSNTMKDWIRQKHGGLSYVFTKGGVTFLCVYSEYDHGLNNPAQAIAPDALAWIRDQLKKVGPDRPVIVAMHLCFDAITNRQAVVDAVAGHNVLAILGGHYHKAVVSQFEGVRFIQFPSPKSNRHDLTVVRVFADRLDALVYDLAGEKWRLDPRVSLRGAAIDGPQAATSNP